MNLKELSDYQKEVIVVVAAFQELLDMGIVAGCCAAYPKGMALSDQIRASGFEVPDENIPDILYTFFGESHGGFSPKDFNHVCLFTRLVMNGKLDREKVEGFKKEFGNDFLR